MSHTTTLEKTARALEGISLDGIQAINSLGGPPLPTTGKTDIGRIKVTLENQACTEIQRWQLNVATMVVNRR